MSQFIESDVDLKTTAIQSSARGLPTPSLRLSSRLLRNWHAGKFFRKRKCRLSKFSADKLPRWSRLPKPHIPYYPTGPAGLRDFRRLPPRRKLDVAAGPAYCRMTAFPSPPPGF